MPLLTQLLRDDDGQDLIEYALVTAAIAFAGALVFKTMGTTMNITYAGWGAAVNNLWEVP